MATAVNVFLCVSATRHILTLLHGPGCNLGNDRGCPLVVHYWADLQSVHGFRCYDNIHILVCNFIALYIANACSAEREMLASACACYVAGFTYCKAFKMQFLMDTYATLDHRR